MTQNQQQLKSCLQDFGDNEKTAIDLVNTCRKVMIDLHHYHHNQFIIIIITANQ